MKHKSLLVGMIAMLAIPAGAQLSYIEKSHLVDVFAVDGRDRAVFSYTYLPLLEWQKTPMGQALPFETSPVLRGLAENNVPNVPVRRLESAGLQDQAREFVDVVNLRNQEGRVEVEIKPGSDVKELWQTRLAETHVVELVMASVIDTPVESIRLNPENIKEMMGQIDKDHAHFAIPGEVVRASVEKGHVLLREKMKPQYLLSAFDFRNYGCAFLKDSISDYFSQNADKDQLANETIYVVSDLRLNDAEQMGQIAKVLRKKPQLLMTQEVLYASHLIRGAKTQFAFFAEGNRTRVVMISHIAMGSKFFIGAKGAFIRQYLLGGVDTGISGAALGAKDALDELLGSATEDLNSKNTCQKGLALGLIRFTQKLFDGFADSVRQPN